jgi:hypothetical protein
MDDVAASQQLMDEESTRAAAYGTNGDDITLPQTNGSHDPSSPLQKKRKRKSAHKSGKNSIAIPPVTPQDKLAESEVPTSSPFPFPATQLENESSAANVFTHSTAIEVPDSQIAVPPAHALASSPMSSHVVPSSATKSKRTYKKSKQTKRDRLSRDAMREGDITHKGDTTIVADEAASQPHTLSKRKSSQVDDSRSGLRDKAEAAPASQTVQSRKAAIEDVDGTPTPAKRRKIGQPKSATRVRDLIQDGSIHDGNDEDGDLLRSVEKTKLKRIKKPQTPVSKAKNIYEIPDDDPRPTNAHGEDMEASGNAEHNDNPDTGVATTINGFAQPGDAGEVNTPKDRSTRKPRGSLKKMKKSKDEIPDSAAPVRTPGLPLGEDGNEDSIMREPVSSDEDHRPDPPPHDVHVSESDKKKKKKRRRSNGTSAKKATPRRESGKFTYTRRKIQTGTAAERALNVDHELNHPPDLRSTGDFTQDEEELIRRAIQDFQQRKRLEVSELVDIIQWNSHDPGFNRGDGTVAGKNDWTPQDIEDARESAEFWDEIKHINIQRSLDRMRRHIRQTYHQFKSGAWTDEEDERLRNLYAMHPNKWKMISVGMGDRSMHDCQNRWRDYLQYGDKLKSSRWDPEEEELFMRAITTVAQRDEDHRAESGLPPLDEYTTKDISWQQVSREMDNTRSRIQVVAKWRNLQKRDPPPHIQVEHKPRKHKPASSASATIDPTPRKRGRPRQGESATPKAHHNGKSQQVIDNSDEDESHSAPPPKKRGRPGKSEGSVVKKSKKFRTTETEDIVDNSEEEREANKESRGSPSRKKNKNSRRSEVVESDKLKKSRSTMIGDDIENSEEDEVRAGQGLNTSPPLKKRGRPRKTDDLESDELKKRRKSKVSPELVEDLELREDDQSEHAESNDKPLDDVKPGLVRDANGGEPQEDGDDAALMENEDLSSIGSPYSVTRNILPNQYPDDGNESVQNDNEIVDPAEDEEDQPSIAPNSPKKDTMDDQLEEGSDAASLKENEDIFGEEDNKPSVRHNGPAEDMDDDQPQDAKDAVWQEEHEEPSSEGNQTSGKPNIPDGEKPTIADTTKMQWGDLYDLIAKLQERRDEEEGEIDWEGVAEEVATDRNYIWSAQTLKTALEEMVQLLRDNDKEVDVDDLPGTVDDIMDFISEKHGNEIEEYYDMS